MTPDDVDREINDNEAEALFSDALDRACGEVGNVSSVLIIPPDITRFHSKAGFLTVIAVKKLAAAGINVKVLPALGTHVPLSNTDREKMFPGIDSSLFYNHDWRKDVVELGRIEKEWVKNITEGAVNYDWPGQVNRRLIDGGFDLIISLGQVVPHEVTGMANHAKNILIGTGGKEAVDKSHFAGAAYGMEKIMGSTDTPVRAMFNEGLSRFGNKLPPVLYALTVLSPSRIKKNPSGKPLNEGFARLVLRGLFSGFGRDCFTRAAALSRKVNINLLDKPIQKAVVYLNPEEFRSAWLGNKAIYRTRMAMADGGELLIIAPGLERFGEDAQIDSLIHRYGYRPAQIVCEKIKTHPDLADNLCAAAHLIHGSSEGRFTIRYCPGPGISHREIESVGYEWGDIGKAVARYNIGNLPEGQNTNSDGEKFFFVQNPALGLWAAENRLLQQCK